MELLGINKLEVTWMKEKIKVLVDYFKSNEKSVDKLYIGPEYEHFIVDRDTYETVSFYGDNGVESIFKRLVDEHGWDPIVEGDYVLGGTKGVMELTTEPGGQFEFSNKYEEDLATHYKVYREFFDVLLPMLDEMNYDILAMGYHPVTKIDDITLLPASRYSAMFNYFKTNGTMSHNMMKGTGALQMSVDYTSEEDYIKKSVVLNALTNLMYSAFENAYFFEGEPVHHNIREKIWQNTDPQRSGLSKNAFIEEGYEGYAKYVLNTVAIFAYIDGKLEFTGDRKIAEFIHPDMEIYELEHLLTMVFPDVRTKNFLEMRVMDGVPYPYNFSAFALLKGLIYHQENLDKLYERFKDITREEVESTRLEMYELGQDAMYLGRPLKDWIDEMIQMSKAGLNEDEIRLLEPLEELLETDGSLYNKTKRIYEETNDVRQAVSHNRITKEAIWSLDL